MQTERSTALQGIRVLDVTIISAGAGATMLLADMGAEIIKVESTSYVDSFRNMKIWPNNEPGEHPWNRSAPFNTTNRNKLGITLDLKHPRGRQIFLELARQSDVVAENFRHGVMGGLGLDYEALKAVKPDLVMISISSQGITGPESHYGSFGSTLDALSGLACVTGYEDGPPVWSGPTVNYPDQLACTLATGAILAGLHHRLKTGEGCYIDFSQRETITSLIGEMVLEYSSTGRQPVRRGNGSATIAPQGCYPSAGDDAWVAISVRTEAEWQKFCSVIGREDLCADPRFARRLDRYANRTELDALIAEWTLCRTSDQAFEALIAAGIPAAPVRGGRELLDDPQLRARCFFEDVTQTEAGTFPIKTRPWKFSKTDGSIYMPAPLLGEHTESVLTTLLGLSPADIAELAEQCVIGKEPRHKHKLD